MTTISVPIPAFIEKFIKEMIDGGYASNKADLVRKALIKLREDEAVNAVLRSDQEIKEGRVLKGDLDTLARKLKSKN